MKNFYVMLAIACSSLLCNNAFAQKDFALIEKNKHTSAEDLFHDLNKTKDTLVLSGDKKIRYVYSINTDYKRETQELVDANSGKIALNHLSKGKHVFVVEQMPLKIVFVVKVLQDRPEFDRSVVTGKLTATTASSND